MNRSRNRIVVLLVSACWSIVSASIARAEPDEAALGKASGYRRGSITSMYAEPYKVGSFSAIDKILKTRAVSRGEAVMPLESGEPATIRYRYQRKTYTLDDYLDRRRALAVLVLKDGQIMAERYRYQRQPDQRFISFSMSKSIISLLIGVAFEQGKIKSLDDPAETYVSELKETAYGRATIRHLLRMSSGVKFVENYGGNDDIAKLRRAGNGETKERTLDILATFNEQVAPPGETTAYASAETAVLGYVLSRATGEDIATLTSRWLWQPLGAEADAAWIVGADGHEQVMGGFNARLRDYGRLGVLLANDGRWNERQIVPREYLLDATDVTRQPEAFQPGKATSYYGYGFQYWLLPMRERTFALLGIFGQAMYVQPKSKLVMVHLSVGESPKVPEANGERDALWRGVLDSLGGDSGK